MMYPNQMPGSWKGCPPGYMNNAGYPMAVHYQNEALVKTIQNCEATCEHMNEYLKKQPSCDQRGRQMMLLRDCADICGLTAVYVARGSMFSKYAAALCACICETCGQECARFPDQMSQNCAMVCLHCARECSAYAGSM